MHDELLDRLERFVHRGHQAQAAVTAATVPACNCGVQGDPCVHKAWCAYVQPALRALEERKRPITALDLLRLASEELCHFSDGPAYSWRCAHELLDEAIDMLEAERR